MTSIKGVTLVVAGLLTVAGCATPKPDDYQSPTTDRYQKDRAYFVDRTKGPQRCLALSGGGIRSAAFSIGVMQALQRVQDKRGGSWLDNVDIISAVSGGSYAASWYYAQHYIAARNKRNLDNDELLLDGYGPYQSRLNNNSRLVTTGDVAVQIPAHLLLSVPANFVLNGIFGFHNNVSLTHKFYKDALQHTFHDDQSIAMADLQAMLRDQAMSQDPTKKRLPFFTINTTANSRANPNVQKAPLRHSVYEFTPEYYGSDALRIGAYNSNFPDNVDLSRVVAVSGAAVDSLNKVPRGARRILVSAVSPDLGWDMWNPEPEIADKWRVGAVPLGTYMFFPSWWSGPNGFKIHLSDGGHSENLGLYSLVVRGCRDILVVDAAHDPNYRFDEYERVQACLKTEGLGTFAIKEIDEWIRKQRQANKTEAPVKCDWQYNDDNASSNNPESDQTDQSEKPRADIDVTVLTQDHNHVYDVKDAIQFDGKPGLNVIYVKMGIRDSLRPRNGEGEKLLSDKLKALDALYGRHVAKYLETSASNKDCPDKQSNSELLFTTDCYFPHRPTWDQDFTSDQFSAYRDLGCMIVGRYFVERQANTFGYKPMRNGNLCF